MTDSQYEGSDRRVTDKFDAAHKRITEQNTHSIAAINSDLNGLKVSLTNIDKAVEGLGSKLEQLATPHVINWPAIGSLIIGVIIVFGGIFGFLFQTQSDNVQDQLTAVQRESDLRHEIRDLHERNLTEQVIRLQDRVLRKMELQEKLNLDFVKKIADE